MTTYAPAADLARLTDDQLDQVEAAMPEWCDAIASERLVRAIAAARWNHAGSLAAWIARQPTASPDAHARVAELRRRSLGRYVTRRSRP